jgi:serine protease inhibitor
MKSAHRVFVILGVILLSGCQFALADTSAVARSDLARETAPQVSRAAAQTLVDGNNAFAFDFYHRVQGNGGNLVYSPYSISLAAALLYGGAGGETASQIASTFHFTLPPGQFHPALNALSLDLAQRPAQSLKVDRNNPLQLYIANAIWGQRDYPFEKNYLDLLAVNYGAGVRLLDFAAAPDSARQKINDWVGRETKGKIKDILPPGSIDPATRLVLANAIYFKAAWQEAFVKKLTRDAPFTLLDGSQVQVPTMQTEGGIPVRVGAGDGYQALAVPYKGDLAEMVIILPDPGRFESVESMLDGGKFASVLDELKPGDLSLYMPRFEFTADFDLTQVLSGMGMPLVFDRSKADLGGITKAERLYAQQALHKAYVLVNEEGTEAAAASVIVVMPASLAPPQQELRIDRPFIFVIRDVPTGAILFVGRVLNPLEN